MMPGSTRLSRDTDSREADRVYFDLRSEVLHLHLAPGSVLDEARVAQQKGVSRTPVREAIIRLVSEGFLKRDGRQIVVPVFQINQLKPFFEALKLLTRETHRMAAERRDEKQLAAILAARDDFEEKVPLMDPTILVELNHNFHHVIALASGNEFLQEAYDKITVQSLWLSRQCYVSGADMEYTDPEHVGPIVEGHRALCEAIRDRDAVKTDLLAAEHCDLFRNSFGQSVVGTGTVQA